MFVVYVQSGRELEVCDQLAAKGITAYAPRKIVRERAGSIWYEKSRIIFDSYIFIDARELTSELWQAVKQCYGALKFVSRSQLSPTEEEYIRLLCNSGAPVGLSRGYVKKGALHITGGFLLELEHRIIRFNRRGHRATAEFTIYGERYRVTFSVEFDPPPRDKLRSGKEFDSASGRYRA